MTIDKLVLITGEVFEHYEENKHVPKKDGFIAIHRPEADSYTRYINTNHILYVEMKNGKIETELERLRSRNNEVIDKFLKT